MMVLTNYIIRSTVIVFFFLSVITCSSINFMNGLVMLLPNILFLFFFCFSHLFDLSMPMDWISINSNESMDLKSEVLFTLMFFICYTNASHLLIIRRLNYRCNLNLYLYVFCCKCAWIDSLFSFVVFFY